MALNTPAGVKTYLLDKLAKINDVSLFKRPTPPFINQHREYFYGRLASQRGL